MASIVFHGILQLPAHVLHRCHNHPARASIGIDQAFAACRGSDQALAASLHGKFQAVGPGQGQIAVDFQHVVHKIDDDQLLPCLLYTSDAADDSPPV